jgi:hypothetical protein
MKNIVLITIIFCSLSVLGQENTTKSDSITNLYKESWRKHTPGQELVIASTKYYTGLTLQIIGAVFIALGNIPGDNYQTNMDGNDFFKVLGAGLTVTGGVYQIGSYIHIKRAGILMDAKNKK